MKGRSQILMRRSVLAAAVAAFSSAGYAQAQCDQEIQQLRQDIQQQQVDQQLRTSVEDLLRAAEQNPSDCDTYIARAEEVLSQRAPGAQQSESQVSQSQQATSSSQSGQESAEIQIDQPPATVDVQTQPAEVLVRQKPIKIQVIVEQQEPEVELSSAEPQVDVSQPEPQVEVDRAQPDVDVSRTKPNVRVEYAEPEVEIVQRGASQQGEQTAQAQGVQSSQQSQQEVDLQDIRGSQVVGQDGEELGEVQEFVRSRTDGEAYVLVEVGSTFGIGGRNIAIPLDEASLNQDNQLEIQMTRQEIEQQEGYNEQNYEEIPQTEFAALESELKGQ